MQAWRAGSLARYLADDFWNVLDLLTLGLAAALHRGSSNLVPGPFLHLDQRINPAQPVCGWCTKNVLRQGKQSKKSPSFCMKTGYQ